MPTLTAKRPQDAPGVLTSAARAYRRAPQAESFLLMALLTGVAAAAAVSLDRPALPVAAVTAAALLLGHVAVRRTAFTLTCALLAVFATLSPLIASAYLAAMGSADFALMLNLCVAAVIVALVAHRTSVGRAPVTVALALLALAVAGPLLTLLLPALGAINGYVAAGAVLYARTRAWVMPSRFRKQRRDMAADSAAARTATLLTGLPPGYTILSDVALPRTTLRAQHLIIGPGGVSVLASMAQAGIVREHPSHGVELDGTPLAPALAPVLDVAIATAAALDLAVEDITAGFVMHGPRLGTPHLMVGLVAADGHTTGRVHLLAPDAVTDLIHPATLPQDALTDPKTVTALVKRARRFKARQAATTDAATSEVSVTVLDEDGRPKMFTDPGHPQPMFRSTSVDSTVLVGQAVSLITDQGTFAGYRVHAAPAAADDGTIVVALCTENKWRAATNGGTEPDTFTYPLASLTAS
jgi:hypothetical protein